MQFPIFEHRIVNIANISNEFCSFTAFMYKWKVVEFIAFSALGKGIWRSLQKVLYFSNKNMQF